MPRVPRGQIEQYRQDAAEQQAESKENTRLALNKVCEGLSVQTAGSMFGIPRATLQQQYNKYKNFGDDQKVSASLARMHGFVTVFSPNEEAALVTYLITSYMCYGLTEIQARKLAYQFALANKKKMPQAWVDHEKVVKEWPNLNFGVI